MPGDGVVSVGTLIALAPLVLLVLVAICRKLIVLRGEAEEALRQRNHWRALALGQLAELQRRQDLLEAQARQMAELQGEDLPRRAVAIGSIHRANSGPAS